MYREYVMHVTAKSFQKLTSVLPEKVVDKEAIGLKVWIVPASCCSMPYINDARYLLGDSTLETERLNEPRDNNLHFLQHRSVSSTEDFSSFRILSAQVLRIIVLGKELLVH